MIEPVHEYCSPIVKKHKLGRLAVTCLCAFSVLSMRTKLSIQHLAFRHVMLMGLNADKMVNSSTCDNVCQTDLRSSG